MFSFAQIELEHPVLFSVKTSETTYVLEPDYIYEGEVLLYVEILKLGNTYIRCVYSDFIKNHSIFNIHQGSCLEGR